MRNMEYDGLNPSMIGSTCNEHSILPRLLSLLQVNPRYGISRTFARLLRLQRHADPVVIQ